MGQRDLIGRSFGALRYSTAVNFSTRFPLFSPAAAISQNGIKQHYLDGGYVENSGSGSMLEMINQLRLYCPAFKQVKPVIITLLFSEDSNTPEEINFGNELTEIVGAALNTRTGNTRLARTSLKGLYGGGKDSCIFIDAPLAAKQRQVPMNWVLSAQSLGNIEKSIKSMLQDTSRTGVMPMLNLKQQKYLKIKR